MLVLEPANPKFDARPLLMLLVADPPEGIRTIDTLPMLGLLTAALTAAETGFAAGALVAAVESAAKCGLATGRSSDARVN